MMIDGACMAVDPVSGNVIPEKHRVEKYCQNLIEDIEKKGRCLLPFLCVCDLGYNECTDG